jgi:cell fate regulator YaaT (PSP1 superfamily)
MKIVDSEIQHDGHKITFFFTADHRVDFRSLVRDLASRYRTRIELRQIGVRDEARRVDGYGICGKRQCCNTFITDFAPISTSHAREQDLGLNPSKISGNCGRLLCCLRYEVEQYSANRKKFPRPGSLVETIHGPGTIDRIDYFREEAVLNNADGVSFRAKPEEIVRVQTAAGGRDAAKRPIRGPAENGERLDEEALKRLDEPEDLN